MPVRLFVGNLPYDVTESELKEFFAAAGPVGQVFMPLDRETGKRRGFAFVEFDDREAAEQAVKKFNNQMLRGRAVSVNEARPKEAGGPRGGHGGFAPRSAPMGPPPPLEPRSRNFGAGGRATRSRRQPGRQAAGEERKKGPIRERRMGRLFGLESDDLYDDDTSSLNEVQDEQDEQEEELE